MRRKNNQIKNWLSITRKYQKEQGYFDGRFAPKVFRNKKKYTRKIKHKNKLHE